MSWLFLWTDGKVLKSSLFGIRNRGSDLEKKTTTTDRMHPASHRSYVRMQPSTPRHLIDRAQHWKASTVGGSNATKADLSRQNKREPWVEGLLLLRQTMVVPVVRLIPTAQFEWKKEGMP